ncbi:MAG TPA: TetR/AcrR family transcriptional regulator [Rhodothermales bacterium]|nr:TetR/AcrR family transcriptional regulator [Rhodothermales bacterium]
MELTDKPPRWHRRPEERPDEILDAALDEFGKSGLAGTRMEDVARRAGLSKGALYLYFKTKDDLFRAVVRRTIEEHALVVSEAAVGETATKKLRALIPVLWSRLRCQSFSTIYRLIYAELHNFPDLTRFYAEEIAGHTTRIIADVLREGVERGEFREMDPYVAARMLVALTVKNATWQSRPELFGNLLPRSDEQALREVSDFFFSAIRPDEPVH